MENNLIMVESHSDKTLVINIPDLPLQRVWKKRGAKYPFDRTVLMQAYYDPSVEYLFREGQLTTDDKEFMINVGLMTEDEVKVIEPLTETKMNRMIKLMPMAELKSELIKLTHTQLSDFSEYCIEHNTDLKMDRIDLISKATGISLFEAIKNYKDAQEE